MLPLCMTLVEKRERTFGLSEIFGVDYKRDLGPAYLTANFPLNSGLTSFSIIEHKVLEVKNKNGSEVLGRIVLPSETDLFPFTYVSAPSRLTEIPGVVKRGQVVYCSGDIGYSFMRASYPDHRNSYSKCSRFINWPEITYRSESTYYCGYGIKRAGRKDPCPSYKSNY